MINNPIIFYIASAILIAFTLLSMFLKNIIYSLLAAIMVFFATAIIFYILGSEYNAIIQAALYGLAVPVIIGISIMFTVGNKEEGKPFTLSLAAILGAIVLGMALTYAVMISLVILPDSFNLVELSQTNTYENIIAFANGIFVNHVWAFELVSLLLTIAIAGLALFNGRRAK